MENGMVLLGYCLRMFLLSAVGLMVGLYMVATMLKPRMSIRPIFTWLISKFIILVWVMQIYLGHLQGNQWYELINFLMNVCGAIVTSFMFYLTFYGGAVKCFMAALVSETMIAVILLPSVLIVNLLQGREDVFLFNQEFRFSDLAIPFLICLFFGIIYYFSKDILKKYRTYQFKHPKVWLIIYIAYAGLQQVMTILDITENNTFLLAMYGVFFTCAVAATLAVIFMYLNYRKGIRLERAYLNTQLGLLETHYQAIQSQIQQMESCQQMIAQQMEELTLAKKEGQLTEHTKEYLQNLKAEYGKLRAGMYCDDWRIDAVLYCQIETARAQGIEVDCQIRGYDKRIVDQQTLAQLLFRLLHNGVRVLQEEKKTDIKKMIKIHTGIVKESFVIHVFVSAGKTEQILNKQIRKLVKEMEGTVVEEDTDAGSSLVFTLVKRGQNDK